MELWVINIVGRSGRFVRQKQWDNDHIERFRIACESTSRRNLFDRVIPFLWSRRVSSNKRSGRFRVTIWVVHRFEFSIATLETQMFHRWRFERESTNGNVTDNNSTRVERISVETISSHLENIDWSHFPLKGQDGQNHGMIDETRIMKITRKALIQLFILESDMIAHLHGGEIDSWLVNASDERRRRTVRRSNIETDTFQPRSRTSTSSSNDTERN